MRRLADGIYTYRGYWIYKNKDGWEIERNLHIFKALADVEAYIKIRCSIPTDREPRIVREWTIEEDYYS